MTLNDNFNKLSVSNLSQLILIFYGRFFSMTHEGQGTFHILRKTTLAFFKSSPLIDLGPLPRPLKLPYPFSQQL